MDFGDRLRLAEAWYELCERDLRLGVWSPTALEQQVAAELRRATRVASTSLPPFTSRHLKLRLVPLATIAPIYRIALRALGDDTREGTTLAALLHALLPLAEAPEQWDLDLDRLDRSTAPGLGGRLPRPGDTTGRDDLEALTETHPDLSENLGEAERFFAGFGSVGELFAAVASGRVD